MNIPKIHRYTLALVACCVLVHGQSINLGKYPQGPVELSKVASLWYDVDVAGDTARFALLVNDSKFVKDGPNWIGFGIGEATSGSMLGADIVTAEFAAGENNNCKVVDRHVPFAAFPLIEQPSVFPVPDDCQNDGSWTLVQCARDISSGQMVLEITRSLTAHDTQDRAIGSGPQSIINAYGVNFRYHGGARSSNRVALYDASGNIVQAKSTQPLPPDVSANQTIAASAYKVPSDSTTTYACTSVIAETGPQNRRMVVAAEPVFRQKTGKSLAHHLLVYACQDGEYFRRFLGKTGVCGSGGVPSPAGNPAAGCSGLLYGWAVGGGRIVYPKEAGALVTEENKFIILETHYDNPDKLDNVIDQSGARLFYADTMRANEAGTLALGDPTVSRGGMTVANDFKYEHTCPSECTEKFQNKSINLYASFLHMHTTGREIYTNKFSKNGSFIQQTNAVNYWSNNHQPARIFDPPLKLAAGESMRSTCVFDTSKRPKTVFGQATRDEMCIEFLSYWPRQRRKDTKDLIYYCSFFLPGNATDGVTLCGDVSKVQEAFLNLSNPVAIDEVGAPNEFGSKVETCRAAETSVEPDVTVSPAEPVSATIDAAPSTENPEGASGDDDNDTCFPASATVELRDGSVKEMSALEIGDMVLVAPGLFSRVFMFTHRVAEGDFRFIRLHIKNQSSVVLTDSHYLYVNGELTTAGSVRRGDLLRLGSGETVTVSQISFEVHAGLYNPQTEHGDIVVNGVQASTYTRSLAPKAAHALLAPFRFAFSRAGLSAAMFDGGVPFFSPIAPSGQ